MTGYYVLEFRLSTGEWAAMTYWEMQESLLPDFLLHVLDLHHSIECRDDLRVRRISYGELGDHLRFEYHGLHIHTSDSYGQVDED